MRTVVICDMTGCNTELHFSSSGADPNALEAHLKKEGWGNLYLGNRMDICPKCMKEMDAGLTFMGMLKTIKPGEKATRTHWKSNYIYLKTDKDTSFLYDLSFVQVTFVGESKRKRVSNAFSGINHQDTLAKDWRIVT